MMSEPGAVGKKSGFFRMLWVDFVFVYCSNQQKLPFL